MCNGTSRWVGMNKMIKANNYNFIRTNWYNNASTLLKTV